MWHAVGCRCYVVGKDVANRVVYVTEGEAGQDHPALLSNTALLHSPQWVARDAPEQLKNGLPLPCSFKARSALLSTLLAPPPLPSQPSGFTQRAAWAWGIWQCYSLFCLHCCAVRLNTLLVSSAAVLFGTISPLSIRKVANMYGNVRQQHQHCLATKMQMCVL